MKINPNPINKWVICVPIDSDPPELYINNTDVINNKIETVQIILSPNNLNIVKF